MELYGQIVVNEAGKVPERDVSRRMAFTAAELLYAGALALNAIRTDSAYGELAYQQSEPVRTPYSHAAVALDGVLTTIAHADGLNDADARTVVQVAGDFMHDMIGESDPVRRAYTYARDDLINEAHDLAIDMDDER